MMCPECAKKDIDSELVFQDDSFGHAFGLENIQFYYCEKCDYQIEAGEIEND